nr:MAG TPA: hypothetical protein [Caudoviricetes sp.]
MIKLTNRGVRVASVATLTGLTCAVICASTESLNISIPTLVACVLCLPFVGLFTYYDN